MIDVYESMKIVDLRFMKEHKHKIKGVIKTIRKLKGIVSQMEIDLLKKKMEENDAATFIESGAFWAQRFPEYEAREIL